MTLLPHDCPGARSTASNDAVAIEARWSVDRRMEMKWRWCCLVRRGLQVDRTASPVVDVSSCRFGPELNLGAVGGSTAN
jgi:hypothetical protein